jgi:hypothetical protein
VKWDDKVKAWLNFNTGTYPSVFHFNGGGKAFVETIHGVWSDHHLLVLLTYHNTSHIDWWCGYEKTK